MKRIKINGAPIPHEKIYLWFIDRGIFSNCWAIDYEIIDNLDTKPMELAPVVKIKDGVLSDVDTTEFILRFGA